MRLVLNRPTLKSNTEAKSIKDLTPNLKLTFKTTASKEFPGYAVQSNGVILRNGSPIKQFTRGKHQFVSIYYPGPLGGTCRVDIKVNRLVSEAFMNKPPYPSAVLIHRDRDRQNCDVENLFWGLLDQSRTYYHRAKPRGQMGRKPTDKTPIYKTIVNLIFKHPDKLVSLEYLVENTGLCAQTIRRRMLDLAQMEKVTVELGKKYGGGCLLNGRPAYFYGVPKDEPLWRLEDFSSEEELLKEMEAEEAREREIEANFASITG